MFKSVLVSLFAVTLFAAGAVGAWYIMNLEKNKPAETETALVSEIAPESPPLETKPGLPELGTPFFGKALNGEDIFRFSEMNKKNLQIL
ncbi:MAG: hypothetical protein KDB27_04855, partial [Planctomycetales bacterium]|nr:hypothetical protein [Planctomycetales bacterium]